MRALTVGVMAKRSKSMAVMVAIFLTPTSPFKVSRWAPSLVYSISVFNIGSVGVTLKTDYYLSFNVWLVFILFFLLFRSITNLV
jgi:hypothetical protein